MKRGILLSNMWRLSIYSVRVHYTAGSLWSGLIPASALTIFCSLPVLDTLTCLLVKCLSSFTFCSSACSFILGRYKKKKPYSILNGDFWITEEYSESFTSVLHCGFAPLKNKFTVKMLFMHVIKKHLLNKKTSLSWLRIIMDGKLWVLSSQCFGFFCVLLLLSHQPCKST